MNHLIEFNIVTLFPEMFLSPFQSSMLKKAQDDGVIRINIHYLRDFTHDKHRITDDSPYGGGPGMVMKVEPVAKAIETIGAKSRILLLTPQGNRYGQERAARLAQEKSITIICGRYEGFDDRIRDLVDEEISIGDYVLTGGEIPAMAVVDSVSRLVPGVLGHPGSIVEESFSEHLLEYPHYTRPEEFRGQKVPPVLLSGNHELIRKWRKRESVKRTWERRRDLLENANLSDEERTFLEEIRGY